MERKLSEGFTRDKRNSSEKSSLKIRSKIYLKFAGISVKIYPFKGDLIFSIR